MTATFTFGGEKFEVENDGLQYILRKHTVSEEGVPRKDVMGYFKSFGSGLERVIKTHLGSQEETVELKQYIERFESAVKEIREVNESEF